MSIFKKTLENQQKVNEAVQAIVDYLGHDIGYSELIESMSKAQTAIMIMTTHYHRLLSQFPDQEDLPYYEDITEFISEVSEVFELIKPFSEMIGQIKTGRID